MKVQIELPDMIVLNRRDSIDLIVGHGMDRVTVHGDGKIVVHGNGGGAKSFIVDVPTVLRELRDAVKEF